MFPPEAVSVAFPLEQIVAGPLMEAIIVLDIVTVIAMVSEQLPEEAITEYVVFEVGATVIAAVVSPVNQE